ncbi:hypothetical protein SVAN01_10109 [Stagonosporopsis vannaccii]|nr:hypothetical protein SVAN01_10109 [Stagonosporopsis vannaccii]
MSRAARPPRITVLLYVVGRGNASMAGSRLVSMTSSSSEETWAPKTWAQTAVHEPHRTSPKHDAGLNLELSSICDPNNTWHRRFDGDDVACEAWAG